MYTNTHWSETITDKTNGSFDLPTDAVLLEIDGKRATHYYSRAANRIIVIDTADLSTWYDLRYRSLLTWMTYVSVEHSWRDLSCAGWFIERLAKAVSA